MCVKLHNVCKITHCVSNYTLRILCNITAVSFTYPLENFTLAWIFTQPAVVMVVTSMKYAHTHTFTKHTNTVVNTQTHTRTHGQYTEKNCGKVCLCPYAGQHSLVWVLTPPPTQQRIDQLATNNPSPAPSPPCQPCAGSSWRKHGRCRSSGRVAPNNRNSLTNM